ncbi:MAG: protein phosphatase 2C domain-containing protein [Pseudomonadota bacterium]
MRVEYAKVSALGDRQDNQDRGAVIVADDAALLVVFDGMGGHSDGALAAETCLKVLEKAFTSAPLPVFDPQGFLYSALALAHDTIVKLALNVEADYRPRATCALALVQEGGSFWAHVGDSRIYQLRAGRVVERSRDHSHVEVLIQEGAITEEEALDHPMRNYVECCLGGDPPVPDMTITGFKPMDVGDVLLTCSDGLWAGITDDDIAALTVPGQSLGERLKALSIKSLSVNSPNSDNTTGTALQWLGD